MTPMVVNPTQVANVAGPLLVGYVLNWGLYGALSVQIYIYYLAFPKDRLAHKILVYGVFILETLQAVLIAHDVFASFVDGFSDFKVLTDMHLSWFAIPVLSGIVAFCAQLFYAFRITILSKSKVIGSIISLLAFIQLAGALISGIEGSGAGGLLNLTSRLDHIGHGLFDITSGVCDIVIAICMTLYLSRMDSGSVKSTHAAVSKIIRLVIGTGSLTAAVAIIDISLYYSGTQKHKAWFLTPAIILGRLYSNSMMVILNNRVEIVGGRGQSAPSTSDIALSNPSLATFRASEPNEAPADLETWDSHGTFHKAKYWEQQAVSAPKTLITKPVFVS
ncbi:hypothetical protein BDZ94DRAFT_1311320 [Collybia nuda]|uniref:DUF6534 domain-containing protein n=1 Tax=Collybia nuda TaxID=64659 RepID=A0A9P5Y0Y4_9AGAR|nr:hypothetical protein BDZ94DRAFT_1311320 [Collybia nuda]